MSEPVDIDKLKAHTFFHLGIGALPLSQWANVFANPDLYGFLGLRCKAFTVWFGTVIDYLRNWDDLDADLTTLEGAGVDTDEVRQIATKLHDIYAELASLHSRETQIFLRDRRLQNVHGRLDIYRRDTVGVSWFNGTSVVDEKITAKEHREALLPYYETDMVASEMQALDQTVTTDVWRTLGLLHASKLATPKLMQLAQRFGVARPNPT